MLSIVGVIAFLTVLFLSLLITRIATIALTLTGLSEERARFQARSAYTGTGFTTGEAEAVVNHPVRRRIIMMLMIAHSAGLVSIVISLILSFAGNTGQGERLSRLLFMLAGVAVFWLGARSGLVDRLMSRIINRALKKWTDLDTRDYVSLLNLASGYTIRELSVKEGDWLAGKTLAECRLNREGTLALGVHREDGEYFGAPRGDTRIYSRDTLILYGRADSLSELDRRREDAQGHVAHEEAVNEQQKRETEEKIRETEYRRKRDSQAGKAASSSEGY